jgi:hypothetical protein
MKISKEIKSIITLVHVHKHLDVYQATQFYVNCNTAKSRGDSQEVHSTKNRKSRGDSQEVHTTKNRKSGGVSETLYTTKNMKSTIKHCSIIDFVTRQTNKFIGKQSDYNDSVQTEGVMPTKKFNANNWTSYHIYSWIENKLAAEELELKQQFIER